MNVRTSASFLVVSFGFSLTACGGGAASRPACSAGDASGCSDGKTPSGPAEEEARVVARAKQILGKLESGDELGPHAVAESAQLSLLAPPASHPTVAPASHSAVAPASHSAVEQALAAADLDGMSPREALALLAELQSKLS